MSDHHVVTPPSLDEALRFLADRADEEWQPIAGGTDLMVGVNAHREERRRWLDLSRAAPEMKSIDEEDGGLVRVGGAATMTALRRSELLARTAPILVEAASTVGAVQIQNRATVAGNLVNASPAGDTLPVWLVLDAEVELRSSGGERRVPYRDFTPSYRQTVRRPDELVTAVRFRPPASENAAMIFRKVGTRAAQAISKVVFAGYARASESGALDDVRLAFGSLGPVPVRAAAAEAAARGKPLHPGTGVAAAEALPADISPIDDVRSTAAYRRTVAANLVREFLAGRPD